jgi:hypothetical protein
MITLSITAAMRKLELNSLPDLVRYAVRMQIIQA